MDGHLEGCSQNPAANGLFQTPRVLSSFSRGWHSVTLWSRGSAAEGTTSLKLDPPPIPPPHPCWRLWLTSGQLPHRWVLIDISINRMSHPSHACLSHSCASDPFQRQLEPPQQPCKEAGTREEEEEKEGRDGRNSYLQSGPSILPAQVPPCSKCHEPPPGVSGSHRWA